LQGTIINIQHYKQRLLDLEKALAARIGQEADQGHAEFIDSAHDVWRRDRCASSRDTVRSEISIPSFRSSPWMRGAPHNGLAPDSGQDNQK
jgi:hypothetical protein